MTFTFYLLGKRLVVAAFILLIVSGIVFFISNLLPGDAVQAILGQSATPEAISALREAYGLDRPPFERYLLWLTGILSGDPGISLANQMPVSDLISDRLPRSMTLAGITAAIAVPLALTIGVLSAMKRNSPLDRALNIITLSLVAVPEFLLATIGVLVFAVELRWFSSLSYLPKNPDFGDYLYNFALPVGTLLCVLIAQMARMTRAAVIEELDKPYAEMALLKGASLTRIALKHALPNAISPIANAIALGLSYLLGGVIVVEVVFNYPGVASLMVDAVSNRDMALLQACAMLFCCGYMLLVLIADWLSIIFNPKR
ncbi:binding-protein-dependent transport systems inner membrane component [Aequoribacter fuscus]|uniref:Binding-protein-dependent transport systems inner membrane component n=1 Tax=Aequoribacter fuscus TaxID=2518989 RepID=F3L4X6_9GAMM|nr:ABC transporter permease [Aequoribacter fuscus]EGG28617.1 binding-protein-dependent transport systems inner membrane component [Aequoribacter fuscus]QHJ87382.1 ABC transporter permease [Aequoribacter fuscus]